MSDPQPPLPPKAPQPVDRGADPQPPAPYQRIVRTYGWPVPAAAPAPPPIATSAVAGRSSHTAAPLVHVTLDASLDARGGLVAYALSQELPSLPGAWLPPYAVAPIEAADSPPAAGTGLAQSKSAPGAIVNVAVATQSRWTLR